MQLFYPERKVILQNLAHWTRTVVILNCESTETWSTGRSWMDQHCYKDAYWNRKDLAKTYV